MTNLHKALGQDVTHEYGDEGKSWKHAVFPVVGAGGFVAESDMAIVHCGDAPVTEGHSVDIGSEIFQTPAPVAYRGAVGDPVFLPGFERYLVINSEMFESILELAAEQESQRPFGDETVFVPRVSPVSLVTTEAAAAGDQIVDVGVVIKVALPCLQNAEHSDLAPKEPAVHRQFLQSLG